MNDYQVASGRWGTGIRHNSSARRDHDAIGDTRIARREYFGRVLNGFVPFGIPRTGINADAMDG